MLVCSLPDQSQSGKDVPFFRVVEISETGPFDSRAGMQAAATQAVVMTIKPGL